jgi:succinate dehydrogenase / fumarate reductase, cytochrome b subunit
MSQGPDWSSRRSHWFELRARPTGMLAFMLHRLTGLGLVFYLFLHLAVLSKLRGGPESWDSFLGLVRSPVFLFLDGILLLGLLFHGLNGLRLTLIGLNLGLRWQKALFWVILVLSIAIAVWGSASLWITNK